METFSALLAICAGNSPVPGEFTAQWPVTRSFDVFFDMRPNKRLSKQSRGWWFETPSRPKWRHYNDTLCVVINTSSIRVPFNITVVILVIILLAERLLFWYHLKHATSNIFEPTELCLLWSSMHTYHLKYKRFVLIYWYRNSVTNEWRIMYISTIIIRRVD